jgi:16S rRNA processing protein RimM
MEVRFMGQSSVQTKEFEICVGVITAVHGVRGHVKIRSFTEHPEDLASFNNIFDHQHNQYDIRVVEVKKDYLIASIDGVDSRASAELLRNVKLYIKRSDLPSTSDDEFYHADLVGLRAYSENGVQLGIVNNIVNFGAGDIVEVCDLATEKTIYYPFTKQFVPEVNIKEGWVKLAPLEEEIAASE